MSFVNLSILLLGSLFVAVPLVLHMAMRQKPRSLAFPAMRFLRQREATNRRRLQWRQWLLLAARCLLVLLMALALARPSVTSAELGPWLVVGILALLFLASLGATLLATIQRRGAMAMASLGLLTLGVLAALGHTTWSMARSRSPLLLGDQKAAVAAVVLLDTSPRMLYVEREQTHLQRAQEITRWLLRQLPQERTLISDWIEKKGMIWFAGRFFISICGGILIYQLLDSLVRIYYVGKLEEKLKVLRERPRLSPSGNIMRKLSETEEDVHLDESQIAEEGIKGGRHSYNYDVWLDDKTGYKRIEKYDETLHPLECSECGYVTLRVTGEEVTTEPTTTDRGILTRHYKCTFCQHRERREIGLAPTTKE